MTDFSSDGGAAEGSGGGRGPLCSSGSSGWGGGGVRMEGCHSVLKTLWFCTNIVIMLWYRL